MKHQLERMDYCSLWQERLFLRRNRAPQTAVLKSKSVSRELLLLLVLWGQHIAYLFPCLHMGVGVYLKKYYQNHQHSGMRRVSVVRWYFWTREYWMSSSHQYISMSMSSNIKTCDFAVFTGVVMVYN
ncbi:hypothetical protein BDR04DRAFT_462400 [Suillus decipiens]|nr:hypothetical protein BDR04DRAFT_462400 [Suillus decipiens]